MNDYRKGKATRANAIPTSKQQVQELCKKYGHLTILSYVTSAIEVMLCSHTKPCDYYKDCKIRLQAINK